MTPATSSTAQSTPPGAARPSRSPWFWVPSLYFSQGIPYVIVMTMSVVMYKRLGISNTDIALYTSWLYLPWVIKPLWSPFVDITRTKRSWVVSMQFLVALGLAMVAFSVRGSAFFKWSLFLFWIMAFASATHDIAADGFYMLSLSKHEQAWWVGLRSTFYRTAMIIGSGLLVVLAGVLESKNGLPPQEIRLQAKANAAPNSVFDPQTLKVTAQDGPLHVVATPSALDIPLTDLSAGDAEAIITRAKKWNKDHGFLQDAEQHEYPAFSGKDLGNAAALLASLQTTTNPVAATLWNGFSAEARQLLNAPGTTAADKQAALAEELNKALRTASLLDPARTAGVPVSDLATWLAQRNPKGKDLVYLNRLVLEDVYPQEFGKHAFHRFWSRYVSLPLGGMLKETFPKEVKTRKATAGNVGVLLFTLSQVPAPDQTVAVALDTAKSGLGYLGFGSSDKGFKLKEGERFAFTAANWNQPAMAVIQLDRNLKQDTAVTFITSSGNIPVAWSITLFIVAGLFLAFSCWHSAVLPRPANDGPVVTDKSLLGEFFATLGSFFQKPGVLMAMAFILLYRFDEAQLSKVISPFLLDAREAGGLGLTTSQLGIAYGTFGIFSLTCGGLLGGFLAAKYGLKRMLPFMIATMYLPKLAFIFLSFTQPESFLVVCGAVSLEQLGYGFGFTAFMLYMLFFADGPHKTAHYAICTGFMALGMMIPGMWSGWVADLVGYKHFFIWVICSALPGFTLALLLKVDPEFGKKTDK